MEAHTAKSVAVIVAHPDDETLWAGGTILSNPSWHCFILSLCRGSDTDRAPKFYKVLKMLKSEGIMGDLDDEPEQTPLKDGDVQQAILNLLPTKPFDLVITHNPNGEYTRHRRHEEVSKAVINLWNAGKITAPELWTFAYEDGNKSYYPKAVEKASIYRTLSQPIFFKKYSLIREVYGFAKNSWEAQITAQSEAFWQFKTAQDAVEYLADTPSVF